MGRCRYMSNPLKAKRHIQESLTLNCMGLIAGGLFTNPLQTSAGEGDQQKYPLQWFLHWYSGF